MSKLLLSFFTGLLLVFALVLPSEALYAQCSNPTIGLPDANHNVDGNQANGYCVSLSFDSNDVDCLPNGISMELTHTYEGDLSITLHGNGEILNVMQRPGAVGNCTGGCTCGSSANVAGFFTFQDGGGPDPEGGLGTAGGAFGVTNDDGCGVGTLADNSFAGFFGTFAPGLIEFEICITDHAFADVGEAADISLTFPCGSNFVCGCTDPTALNYDPDATVDDGSCIYDCPDFMMTVNQALYEFCAGDNSFTMIVNAPGASGATYDWTATNGGDAFLSNPFSNVTTVTLPPDFIGDIVYTLTVTDEFGCMDFIEVEVLVGEGPEVEIIGDEFVCVEGTTTLELVGGPFDDIMWNTGDVTDNINVGPGFYEVTVEDGAGCASTAEFTVQALPSPEPEIIGPELFCVGGDALLELTDTYAEYMWSTGEATPDIVVFEPGDYDVTVYDFEGCMGTATYFINTAPEIIVEITGEESFCEGDGTIIMASPGYITYDWSNGDPFSDIFVDQAGIYSVTVTNDLGCEGEAEFEVFENPLPEPEIVGPEVACVGETITLDAMPGYQTYDWSTGFNTQTTPVDAPGLYSVTVTDSNGCQGETDFEVIEGEPVDAVLEGDLGICVGESTTLTITPGYDSYVWSNGLMGNEQTITIPGGYLVTVTSVDGCEQIVDFSIQEFALPTPTIIGDLVNCTGETGTVSLDEPYVGYMWNDNSTDPTLEVSGTSTVSVTVTDGEGCVGSTTADISEITPTVDISGDLDFCLGETTTLTVPDNFSGYAWSTGGTTNEVTVSGNTPISVTVTDANGCTALDTVNLTEFALPTVDIDGRLTFCPAGGTELTATEGFVDYLWSNDETSSMIFLNQAGTYTVTVTDTNGCQNSSSVVTIEDAELDPTIIGEPSFCDGLSTSLEVSEDFLTYDWSNSTAGSGITVSTPGTYTVTVADEFGCFGTATIDVVALPLPEPMIGGQLDYCIGDSTTLTGGAGYMTYQWSVAGQSDQFLTATSPGSYGLTVTDDNGCIGSTTTTVIENALPVTAIQGEAGFCPGLTTVLTAENGFVDYQWSTGVSGTSIEVGTAETFMLSVTDANGCVGIADLPVIEYATEIPEITGELQFCPGGNTLLNGEAGFNSYNWSNGSTESSVTIDAIGQVELIVTDANDCVTTNSVDLSNFVVTPPTIDAVDGFCTGLTADLTASPGYAEYLWSNTEQTETITVSTGGVYELDVIDINGCASGAAIAIDEYDLPTPNIGGSLTFCIGNSTTLNAGAQYAQYQWSTGGDQQEVIVNVAGDIGLTVTDSNGCVGSSSERSNRAFTCHFW